MLRRVVGPLLDVVKSGRVSQETKTGRLAKMFRTEVIGKDTQFEFAAFGDHLISKTITAMSIGQSSTFDDLPVLESEDKKIMFTPYIYDTPQKNRGNMPSIRFHIESGIRLPITEEIPVLRIASATIPDILGKRMHELYLKSHNAFVLRCVGNHQASLAVQGLALFNEKVESHKLQAYLSSEIIQDAFDRERQLRALLFNVDVVSSQTK